MSNIPHLDNDIQATLRDVMGDDFALLIDTFINDSHDRIKALAEGIAQLDSDGLRRAAHSFKGSSSNVGAVRLAESCRLMETLALAGNPEPWAAQLSLIERDFAEVCLLLRPSN